MSDHRSLFVGAEAIAREAASRLLAMQRAPLRTVRKSRLDVVTDADLAAERIILDGLRRLTPHAAILSEEAGASGPEHGARWVVDPLDGTVNYASGLPWFSVTLAYQENDATEFSVVCAPAMGLIARYRQGGDASVNGEPARVSATADLADAVVSVVLTGHFSDSEVERSAAIVARLGRAARGVRIVVSGALEMSLVACGRLDAFVSLKADIFSHAGAMPLLRAAGGPITTLSGRDAGDSDLEKIASNGRIHDELLACLCGV